MKTVFFQLIKIDAFGKPHLLCTNFLFIFCPLAAQITKYINIERGVKTHINVDFTVNSFEHLLAWLDIKQTYPNLAKSDESLTN